MLPKLDKILRGVFNVVMNKIVANIIIGNVYVLQLKNSKLLTYVMCVLFGCIKFYKDVIIKVNNSLVVNFECKILKSKCLILVINKKKIIKKKFEKIK